MVEKFEVSENSKMDVADKSYSNSECQNRNQYLAASLATLSAVALGTHLSWSSSASEMLLSPSPFSLSMSQLSWVGALITLGAGTGAIPAGAISTLIGPKRVLQILALPLFLSWCLIAFSSTFWSLCLGRFIAGLGSGATCVAAPMYVAEIANAKIKGTLGTFFQLQITVGLLVGYILGGTIHSFELLALISSIVPIVFLITFSFMPESPVFLCSKSRIDEARKSLRYLRGPHYDVEDELSRIRHNLNQEKSNRSNWFESLTTKANLKALFISLCLMFFQQLSGINGVLFYAVAIFQEAGSSLSPHACTVIMGIVQVLATYASTLLIDRLGRKILLVFSAGIMAICIGLLGLYFHLKSCQFDLSNLFFLPLVCVAVFIIAFSIGYGPIPWIMLGELFSPSAKGIASSLSAAFNWILAFKVTFFFLRVKMAIGPGLTFGCFALILVVGVLFSLLIVPETKGKDIEEIQETLSGRRKNVNNSTI